MSAVVIAVVGAVGAFLAGLAPTFVVSEKRRRLRAFKDAHEAYLSTEKDSLEQGFLRQTMQWEALAYRAWVLESKVERARRQAKSVELVCLVILIATVVVAVLDLLANGSQFVSVFVKVWTGLAVAWALMTFRTILLAFSDPVSTPNFWANVSAELRNVFKRARELPQAAPPMQGATESGEPPDTAKTEDGDCPDTEFTQAHGPDEPCEDDTRP